MKKLFLPFTSLCLLAMVSCTKTNFEDGTRESDAVRRLSAGDESNFDVVNNNYILRPSKSDKNSIDALTAKVESLGGKVSGYLPQLNMMFVTGGGDGFENNFTRNEASVAADLLVETPQSQVQEFVSFDEADAIGGDNPPSIGNTEPFFNQGRMWGLDAIDAPQAWNAGFTGEGVTVAVLDEGFYPNHPDLAANFVMSKARNFVNLEDISTSPSVCISFPECDPTDVRFKLTGFSHGTHVSGTIAAVKNNIGTIGVAPNAKVIPVKVLSDFAGGGIVSWIVQGIVYAADNGAQVINMSLGGLRIKGSGKGSNLIQEGIRAYNDAIQYATGKGALVICSAGNSGINFDAPYVDADGNVTGSIVSFPAGAAQALSISATSPNGYFANRLTDLDIPTPYTNFGNSAISFAAPGGAFYLSGAPGQWDAIFSPASLTGYFYSAGTSMAAPHVTGVAALIIQKLGGSASPAEIRRILRGSSDKLPDFDRGFYGHGRVNAWKAVQ
jgi:lantibiotic leader peptide-processing serine protease